MRLAAFVGALAVVPLALNGVRTTPLTPVPAIAYTLRVDSARLDVVDVALRISGVPDTVVLAMKVHPEYDAMYWRYLDGIHADGSADDAHAAAMRAANTLWRVVLPGGRGVVHYQIHVPPQQAAVRRAWQPFMRPTGGLINPPDFFLYLPDFAAAPVRLHVDVPRSWRVATSLRQAGPALDFSAPNAAELLDAPILMGHIWSSSFRYANTTFHIDYWPLPTAAPFDTAAMATPCLASDGRPPTSTGVHRRPTTTFSSRTARTTRWSTVRRSPSA